MGRYLDLWDVSDDHPEARKELERLRRIEKTMEALQENLQIIKHKNTYILCRDSWLAMIEEALKDA